MRIGTAAVRPSAIGTRQGPSPSLAFPPRGSRLVLSATPPITPRTSQAALHSIRRSRGSPSRIDTRRGAITRTSGVGGFRRAAGAVDGQVDAMVVGVPVAPCQRRRPVGEQRRVRRRRVAQRRVDGAHQRGAAAQRHRRQARNPAEVRGLQPGQRGGTAGREPHLELVGRVPRTGDRDRPGVGLRRVERIEVTPESRARREVDARTERAGGRPGDDAGAALCTVPRDRRLAAGAERRGRLRADDVRGRGEWRGRTEAAPGSRSAKLTVFLSASATSARPSGATASEGADAAASPPGESC